MLTFNIEIEQFDCNSNLGGAGGVCKSNDGVCVHGSSINWLLRGERSFSQALFALVGKECIHLL